MRVGNNDIKNILIGESPIVKMYQGDEIIWKKQLPTGYTELKYLQSSGTQYIKTGIYPTSTTNIDLSFMYMGGGSTSWIPIFGERSSSNLMFYALFVNKDNLKLSPNYSNYDPGSTSTMYVEVNKLTNWKNIGNNFYIDDVLSASTDSTITTSDKDVWLFELHQYNDTPMSRGTPIRIYNCKFYQNNFLVRNYIPCLDTNNTPCLYDTITETTFYNRGTGTFGYETMDGTIVNPL